MTGTAVEPAASTPHPVVLALAPPSHDSDCAALPALADLGGRNLVQRLLATVSESSLPSPLVITRPPALARMRAVLGPDVEVHAVEAGRREALRVALEARPDRALLLFDAERALTPTSVVREVLDAMDQHTDAVVPVIPLTDSVKQTVTGGLRNIDRSTLASLQSPRLIRRATLEKALETDRRAGDLDEIVAALARGARVRTVHGSHAGFAVLDRLGLWQAQIALGLARDTSHRHGLARHG